MYRKITKFVGYFDLTASQALLLILVKPKKSVLKHFFNDIERYRDINSGTKISQVCEIRVLRQAW